MKKILFLTAFPPNTKTAGQNYSKNLIEDLSSEFSIDLVSFTYPKHSIELKSSGNIETTLIKTSALAKIFNNLILFFLHPLFTGRFDFLKLIQIKKKIDAADVVYLDFSQVFLYSLLSFKKPKILMVHDVISQKYSRKKNFGGYLLTAMAHITELLLFKVPNTSLLTFSEKDSFIINDKYKTMSAQVNFYLDSNIRNINYSIIKESNAFCFYGAWSRSENSDGLKWFFDNVYQMDDLTIKYQIIGGGLRNELFKKLSLLPNVEVMGFVEDPYEVISTCRALIAPVFQGAGVKVKVIESLACGTPVIGTGIAFEGISSLFNKYMVLVDSPSAYREAISNALSYTNKYKVRCRELFLNNYNSDNNLPLIKTLI